MIEVSENKNPDQAAGKIVFSDELIDAYMSYFISKEYPTKDDLIAVAKLGTMREQARVEEEEQGQEDEIQF